MSLLLASKHLLILCCYGGTPYLDMHVANTDQHSTQTIDPTDWIAIDTAGMSSNYWNNSKIKLFFFFSSDYIFLIYM